MVDNLPARQGTTRMPARQSKPTPAQTGGNNSGGRRPNINITYVNSDGGDGGGRRFDYRNSWVHRTMSSPPKQVPVPDKVPRFLGNNMVVSYAWLGSMILVGVDEWKNNGILARPVRLWTTSLVYGILALAGMIDALIPLVNAFAIGYFIMLLWQFFNGSGQFSKNSG
jgi:hypothetical protein